MLYRVMSNDVGPHAYSGLDDVEARTFNAAVLQAVTRFGRLPTDPRRRDQTLRLLVLPHDKFHLHSGTTGKILPEAERYVVEVE